MSGRPRIYKTTDELQEQIDNYFSEKIDLQGNFIGKVSINGLTLFLGFADKTTLYDYRDREEFSHPIKQALTIIEQYHEERLSENSVAGSIFALKNMGWKDKTETDIKVEESKAPAWFLGANHTMITTVQQSES